MRKTTTLALLLMLAALPPAVAPARVIAPPGNSEADQYYQTLPGSTGPRAPATKKTAEDAVRDGSLTPATERALSRRGEVGLAVATAVARTAPVRTGSGGNGGSPLATTADAAKVPGDQGLGGMFVPSLVIVGAAALTFFVLRRRQAPAR